VDPQAAADFETLLSDIRGCLTQLQQKKQRKDAAPIFNAQRNFHEFALNLQNKYLILPNEPTLRLIHDYADQFPLAVHKLSEAFELLEDGNKKITEGTELHEHGENLRLTAVTRTQWEPSASPPTYDEIKRWEEEMQDGNRMVEHGKQKCVDGEHQLADTLRQVNAVLQSDTIEIIKLFLTK
jgi:hypothetical protein